MKIIRNAFGLLVLLGGFLVGGIPFLISAITALIVRKIWMAYVMAFVLTIAVTILSAAYPETFRFGEIDLRVHDSLTIGDKPTIYANLTKNLFMAYIGVMMVAAFMQGSKEKDQQVAAPNP